MHFLCMLWLKNSSCFSEQWKNAYVFYLELMRMSYFIYVLVFSCLPSHPLPSPHMLCGLHLS